MIWHWKNKIIIHFSKFSGGEGVKLNVKYDILFNEGSLLVDISFLFLERIWIKSIIWRRSFLETCWGIDSEVN